MYVRHARNGKTIREGTGLTFWYRPATASISEVPIEDQEITFNPNLRLRGEYQAVWVNGVVRFRIAQPSLISTRLDFSIDSETGLWNATPLEGIGAMIQSAVKAEAVRVLKELTLAESLEMRLHDLSAQFLERIQQHEAITSLGLEIVGLTVSSILPSEEVAGYLQQPHLEHLQQIAAQATFERRAKAVEHERAIAENELQNEIELAKRREQLVAQEGNNERMRAEEEAAARRIESESWAERARRQAATDAEVRRVMSSAEAEATREVGLAEGDADAARYAAYQQLEPVVVWALALRDLAANMPNIGTLNVTPDMLSSLLAKLTSEKPAVQAS